MISIKYKPFIKTLTTSLLTLSTSAVSLANSSDSTKKYCIALRGNGELVPAHWGALAQTVEKFGIPSGMSGGSSASISTFLMESFMMNPTYKSLNTEEEKIAALSLMIKSLKGFVQNEANKGKYTSAKEIIKLVSDESQDSLISKIKDYIKTHNSFTEVLTDITNLNDIFSGILASKVFYGPLIEKVHTAVLNYIKVRTSLNPFSTTEKEYVELQIEYNRLKEALSVFGKFNAQTDLSLFVRGGIINFEALANVLGYVADFYSQEQSNDETRAALDNFIKKCATISLNKTWDQLLEHKEIKCNNLFIDAMNKQTKIFANKTFQSKRTRQYIGATLPSLISTSILTNNSAKIALKIKNDYEQHKQINDETLYNLHVNPNDLKFGYWGQDKDLKKVQETFSDPSNPLSQIDKSQRFFPIGRADWLTALKNSPAEPGLSSMNGFTNSDGKKLVSLGGWSDLHPVPVLKAMGCENVVYLTRRSGEALFAQGVAKRLLKLDVPSWEDIGSTNAAKASNNRGKDRNEFKISSDFDGQWSNMFNLKNPNSSFSVSIKSADAVVCTDWNAFSIPKQFTEIIEEAYTAPIYFGKNSTLPINFSNQGSTINQTNILSETDSLADDNESSITYSFPKYAGCFPFDE